MALAPSSSFGGYDIVALIGVGGMGEVYRARDRELGRDVALKILPEPVSTDPERLARFKREAQVLASLNDPHIAGIYGVQEAAGIRALVLELVEGPTLADRMAQGPIALDEALPIARQIAEALEAAHEQGIIHRDLKPANIKVRPDGTVKVLDFGLAKLSEPAAAAVQSGASLLSQSPTITTPAMTQLGVILGTAAYMSPEQARGKPADKRADLWAFGCVLFEMLTGQRAFAGDDITDTLAFIITKNPNWTQLPADTPPSIHRLLRRCLEKNRRQRLDSAGAVRLDLDDSRNDAVTAVPAKETGLSRFGERIAWSGIVAVLVALSVVLARRGMNQTGRPAEPESRYEINTPATTDTASFALSPDGRELAFVASGGGPARLWLRALNSTSPQPIAGTEGAAAPFWSPDSRSIGFFADGKLKRLDVGGGAPRPLASAPQPRGGTWNRDGVILFAPSGSGPLYRVSSTGGDISQVTRLDRQTYHRAPFFLPDGSHFLFGAVGETSGIYIGSLDSGDVKKLIAPPADKGAVYTASGWVLWVRADTLVGQQLDLRRREMVGSVVPIADSVVHDNSGLGIGLSVSNDGMIAYRAGGTERRQLRWFDITGKAIGAIGSPDEFGLSNPRISPDGRRVAAERSVGGQGSRIWLLDDARLVPFSVGPGADYNPRWSPNGEEIIFRSKRPSQPVNDLYVKSTKTNLLERLLLKSSEDKSPNDWSPDGRFLLYRSASRESGYDLWILPLDGTKRPYPFRKTPVGENAGAFSPDGRWIAYFSDNTGRNEVYIAPFDPALAGPDSARDTSGQTQWQVTTGGGTFPAWWPDGKKLLYLAPDGRLMATTVASSASAVDMSGTTPLFQTHIYGGGNEVGQGRQFDISKDGRILINTVLDEANAPITLLQHWNPEGGK